MRGGFALAACALALIASGAGSAHAATQRPTVFVAPFDLFDTAADQRPAIVTDQHLWLRHAASRIRADLDRAGRAKAVGTRETLSRMKRIDADYDHPSTCASCLVSAARQAGSRLPVRRHAAPGQRSDRLHEGLSAGCAIRPGAYGQNLRGQVGRPTDARPRGGPHGGSHRNPSQTLIAPPGNPSGRRLAIAA